MASVRFAVATFTECSSALRSVMEPEYVRSELTGVHGSPSTMNVRGMFDTIEPAVHVESSPLLVSSAAA